MSSAGSAGLTRASGWTAHRRARVGVAATASGWLFFLLCQVVSGDYLPPAVSMSQYGLGPWGFLFTLWMLSLAVAAGALYGAGPGRNRWVGAVFGVSIAGLVVTALVRTDSDGAQHSWHAHLHLVGSVLALAALPLGIVVVTRWFARPGKVITVVLVVVVELSLVLLLLAAAGIDTAGGGAVAAWAFWQSVAVGCEMVLLLVWAALVSRGRRVAGSLATRRAA